MNLDDKRFLDRVIDLYGLIYINDIVLLIDVGNIIVFAGSGVSKLVNKSTKHIIGKSYLEALPLPKENINNIVKSMNKTIQSKNIQEFLSINLNHSNQYAMLHCLERPIINPTTNNIVAISVESRQLDLSIDFYKVLMLIKTKQKIIANTTIKHVDNFLTQREHEIAFLLEYCNTADKIANILSILYDKKIATKTIHNIIRQQLYPKFEVYNMDALQAKIGNLGYHKKIPVSFLINLHFDLSLI